MKNWRQYVSLQPLDLPVGLIYSLESAPDGTLAVNKYSVQADLDEDTVALKVKQALNSLPFFETSDATTDIYEQMQTQHRVELAVKLLTGSLSPSGEYKTFDNGVMFMPCNNYLKPIVVVHYSYRTKTRYGIHISNQLEKMGYVCRVDTA